MGSLSPGSPLPCRPEPPAPSLGDRIFGAVSHAPRFTVEVRVKGLEPLSAQGRSRQEAEKAAAAAVLEREGLM